MDSEVQNSFRVLDIPTDSSQDEVTAAWREQVKVWHPDRFHGDERLQRKSGEKMKEINSAYNVLRSYFAASAREASPKTKPSPAPPPLSRPTKIPPQPPQTKSGDGWWLLWILFIVFYTYKSCTKGPELSAQQQNTKTTVPAEPATRKPLETVELINSFKPGEKTVHPPTIDQWKRIRTGMTATKVVEILGQPREASAFTWAYVGGGYINFNRDGILIYIGGVPKN